MSGWSERDLATIRAADEIIITRDRGDCTPGLAVPISALARGEHAGALFGSGLAVSPRTLSSPLLRVNPCAALTVYQNPLPGTRARHSAISAQRVFSD
jgi:hypothetical protein